MNFEELKPRDKLELSVYIALVISFTGIILILIFR